MKISMLPKGGKIIAFDYKERVIYTIKKKKFSSTKYQLYDKTGYEMYSFQAFKDEKAPYYQVYLNDKIYQEIKCTSRFLDPGFNVTGDGGEFSFRSKDRKEFEVFSKEKKIGFLKVLTLLNGDKQYEMDVDDKEFDDVMTFWPICVHITFNE